LEDQEATPFLIEHLNDESEIVRITISWALGNIGDPTAIPHLETLLQDQVKDVTYHAACALARLGNASGRALLIEMSQSMNEVSRQSAKEALKILDQASE
jgi:HEAT repeat protein